MKIGIMVDSLRLPAREGIRKAKELGATGLQMYAVAGELSPEGLGPAARRELADFIHSQGLTVAALCGDLGGHGFQVAEDNPARIERSKRIMELAKDLGTDVVTTHIGVVPENERDRRYQVLHDACTRLGEFADTVGAVFAIETGPEPAARLGRFIRSLSCKGIRVNFDPANLAMVIGENASAAVRDVADLVVHTHAKDGIMLQRPDPVALYGAFADGSSASLKPDEYIREVPLGEGAVDFPAYLAALKDIGFDGFLTIEREVGDKPEEDIRRAVQFLSRALGQGR
jgi:L-ribulose-5-phosphate 3-epimerase